MNQSALAIKGISIQNIYIWSTLLVSSLIFASSMMGIFLSRIYSRYTSDYAMQARAQDVVDLVAVAILLAGAFLMYRRVAIGLQLWAGALVFLIYGFVIYSFAAPFNDLFLLYVAIFGLLVYTFLGGVFRLDLESSKEYFMIGRRSRLALGSLLLVLAFAFYFIWLSQDVPAIISGTLPAGLVQDGLLVNPVLVLDMGLYLPAMIITGLSLLKSRTIGYFFAYPFLLFAMLTFLGIFLMTVI